MKLCVENINRKMSNKVKDIDKKACTYYLFGDIIIINNFNPNNNKIDEKSYKNILINYIGYVMIKDLKYVKINRINPYYLIFSKVNGYFEKVNKTKYVMVVITNKSKEKNYKI